MANGTGFDWAGTFLNTTPVNTPNYSNKTIAGTGGEPRTNYANRMARLYVPVTAEVKTELKDHSTLGNILDTVLVSEGADTGYIDFILREASHSVRDVVQVVDTLDDIYSGYSFGQSPATFQYQLALMNNKQDMQAHRMYRLYSELIRAYRLAHTQQLCHLQYDGYIVKGYITDFTWTLRGDDESYVAAGMNMLVKSVTVTPDINATAYSSAAVAEAVRIDPTAVSTTPAASPGVTPPPPAQRSQ